MYSFPRAVVAGVFIGLLQTHVFRIHLSDPGLFEFVLFILVVGAILFQTRGESEGRASFAFVSKRRPVPEYLRSIWWIRHFMHIAMAAALVVAIVVPSSSRLRVATGSTPASSRSPCARSRSRSSPDGQVRCPSPRWHLQDSGRSSPQPSTEDCTSGSATARSSNYSRSRSLIFRSRCRWSSPR